MNGLKLFLLGPPQIELGDRPLSFSRRKTLALLIYLAVTGAPQRRDTLATLLWPDSPQSQARASLSRDLSILNNLLGQGWLTADRETVCLYCGPELWLDVAQFQQQLAECRGHGHPSTEICVACLDTLVVAANFYRDDFLTGFTLQDSPDFDDWQLFQAERLRQELVEALVHLVQGYAGQSEFKTALVYAQRWLSLDPLHEPAHRCLMQLYTWAGDRSAALHQYQECTRLLKAELDLPPSSETAELYEAIRVEQGSKIILPPPPLPLSPPASSPRPLHNLPAQLTPLLGREAELRDVTRLLAEPELRLISLVGPGGIGKTHLALEITRRQLDQFSHGVYFVSLASLGSPEAMIAATAKALNFSFYEKSSPQQQLCDYLRQKRLLLVLDNFEHLLDPPLSSLAERTEGASPGGAALVVEWLQTAPALKILVTSRVGLKLQGEQLFPLDGIDFPNDEAESPQELTRYSAVQLFVQAARRLRPEFESTDDEAAAVAHICRLVQGMPLGILLAASWIDLLKPTEIAGQIGQSLDFLAGDRRDLPQRQQSLRAVFDHSWRLLTEPEQIIFQQLSVFRGGFTYEAAQAVAGTSLAELRALVNKSLLRRLQTGRYELHELLRQYGAEKLAQAPPLEIAARDRHSAYYCTFLQAREAGLRGKQQKITLDEIQVETGNTLTAWNWAVEQRQIEAIDQAMESLYQFYWLRNRYQEGEKLFKQLVECLEESQTLLIGKSKMVLGKALARQGAFCVNLGLHNLAEKLLQRSLALARHWQAETEIAFCLIFLGDIVAAQADPITAESLYQESLTISQAVGHPLEMADALERLGSIAQYLGDYLKARSYHQQSLSLLTEAENQGRMAYLTDYLGYDNFLLGEYGEAEQHHRQSLAFFKEMGDQFGMALALGGLSLVAWGRGGVGLNQAKQLMAESLALCHDIGLWDHVLARLSFLGDIAISMGRYEEAQKYFEEGVDLAKQFGLKHKISWFICGLGEAALGLDDFQASRSYLLEALETVPITLHNLVIVAATWGILLKKEADDEAVGATSGPEASIILERKKQAVEILSLVITHPATWQIRRDRIAPLLAELEAELPPELYAAARTQGQTRDMWATAQELLVELRG